jgi:tetratricopeptide (TPR) repeat protein
LSWRHGLAFICGVVIAALLPIDSTAVGQDQCRSADALRNAKAYEKALEAYVELLKGEQKPACAQTGLAEIVRVREQASLHLGRGKVYEAGGDREAARDAYIEALKVDPTFSEAQTALDRVLMPENTTDSVGFAQVRALANYGFNEEAAKKLQEIVENKPDTDVPGSLRYRITGTIPYLELPRSYLERVARTVGGVLAVVAILALALFSLWKRVWPWFRSLLIESLDIQDFDKGATTLDIGKGVAARVEETYKGFTEQVKRPQVNLITGPIQLFALPADIKGATPSLRIISDLIQWAFPSKVINLSGYLQQSDSGGAGLTLVLAQGQTGEILADETIWQADYSSGKVPTPQDALSYLDLAEPAAIWALYKLEEGLGGRISGTTSEKFRLLGTEHWQSYAFFRAGVRRTREEKVDEARQMYRNALKVDSNNRGASLNLGILHTKAREYGEALECLSSAQFAAVEAERGGTSARENDAIIQAPAGSNPMDSIHTETVWYVATYQLAATYDYRNHSGDRELATQCAYDLVSAIGRAIDYLRRPLPKEPSFWRRKKRQRWEAKKQANEYLLAFLKRIRPQATMMYAAVLARLGQIDEARTECEKVTAPDLDAAQVQYNLAAYHSGCGESFTGEEQREAYELALSHLDRALQKGRRSMAQWARQDPSLEGVRQARRKSFDTLVNKHLLPPPESATLRSLAKLAVAVGRNYGRRIRNAVDQ